MRGRDKQHMKNHTVEDNSPNKPCTSKRHGAAAAKLCAGLALISVALLNQASADTLKQGTIYNETWTTAGSPYRLVDNCTVPSGYTLTVQPGVLVKIDEGYAMTVNGQILAEGSPTSGWITFRSTQAGRYWNKILVQNWTGKDSRFSYCDFTSATNAIYFVKDLNYPLMGLQVASCAFSNCVGTCVQADLLDSAGKVMIISSRFSASANGFGLHCYNYYAGTSVLLANSVFEQISGRAAWFFAGYGGPQAPMLLNNVFNNCGVAVYIEDDQYDCSVYNNIIKDSSLAIRTSGSSSRNVYYNCLFNNQTNFVGYPPVYGRIDDVNANGTPADAFMNMTNNPLFCETTNYTLLANSPCIDAGNPAGAYLDNCFAAAACQPGALGTVANDMGIYGGPNDCGWVVPPWNPTNFTLAAQRYFGVILNPGVPGHYRIEWSPVVTNGTWTQATNVWLTTFPYIYIDYDSGNVSKRFYRGVLLP